MYMFYIVFVSCKLNYCLLELHTYAYAPEDYPLISYYLKNYYRNFKQAHTQCVCLYCMHTVYLSLCVCMPACMYPWQCSSFIRRVGSEKMLIF